MNYRKAYLEFKPRKMCWKKHNGSKKQSERQDVGQHSSHQSGEQGRLRKRRREEYSDSRV